MMLEWHWQKTLTKYQLTNVFSLKVVDDEHETVDVVTNSHDFKLYEEDYVDVNLNGGRIANT